MKHFFFAAALLLATTLSMNLNAQKVSDADTKAITGMYDQLMAAFSKADAAAAAGFFTESGTHVDPTGMIITGRAALKPYFERLFSWFKSQPQPDKTDKNITGWNSRYLNNDLVLITYNDEQTDHFGNKTEKTVFAMTVVVKRTPGGWLCEQVSMTPVRPMQ